MYSFLKVKLGHLKRGFASGKTLDGVYSVTLEELKQNHGLLVEGSWEHLDFDEDTKQFMKHLIKNNHDLLKEADIKIMTLHGSKGKESDNVVGHSVTDEDTKDIIESITNYKICPHTACALDAIPEENIDKTLVVMATAHPCKFNLT